MKKIEQIKLLEDTSGLYINGKLDSEDNQIIVKLDETIILEAKPNLAEGRFSCAIEELPLKDEKMIFVIEKSKNYENLLCKKSIKCLLKKKNRSKKVSYIKRNFLFLWKEYHFLIPPKKLKEYIGLFINRIILNKKKSDLYYQIFSIEDYNDWLRENKENLDQKIKFSYNPLISVIMPVYNVNPKYLREAIDSVLNQTYSNFELCIADDASTSKETIEVLKEAEKQSSKIKVVYRKENGHISRASNSAIEIAQGEFLALLDNDDVLTENALYEVVKKLNENKDFDLIYSDEDKINLSGRRCDPHFKPDWSPDTLLSHNYICHLAVIRTELVKQVGMFRVGYEGSQDYDLMLRITEKTNKICHIPKILYHWRMVEGSTSMTTDNKSYASENGIKALKDAFRRRNIKVDISNIYTSYIVQYKLSKKPKVSILIPTKDKIDLVLTCIHSIYEKTEYQNFEIIIINNNSQEKRTFLEFGKLQKQYKNIKIITDNGNFNFSRLNNLGVKNAEGEYILFLNNDIEIIDGKWLEIMLGYAMQDHIGAVGPKLIYKNNTIQHAGVVVGVGVEKIANHASYLKDKFAPALAGRLMVPYNYSAVTGACLLVSKKKYLEVGGLSEDLEINYNDIDFCLKLLQKGYYNVFLPQVEIYHYESLSRGKKLDEEKEKELRKSISYMHKKWNKFLENDPFYNPNLSKEMCFVLDKKGE